MWKMLILLILILTNVLLQSQIESKKLNGIDAYIKKALTTFEVPGASVAVVKNGKVILAKGFGKKTLDKTQPVDSQTLFGIASNTKALTATALALLVEEGKIEWDKPVINYLPWFRMSDPYVTSEMTIRDLLVHRSGLGLGSGDLLWWPTSTYTRKEIIQRLRFVPLATSFRSAYAYDNVLYTVAGEVIKEVSGQVWEDFVSQRILKPVGMAGSDVRHSATTKYPNVASTHARVEGEVQKIAPFTSDNVNPAGGINSNAEDMAKWMIVQLDSGRLADGSYLFPPHVTKELWNLVTPIPIKESEPELAPMRTNFKGYALGFRVQDYRGYKLVTHTGGLPGYLSLVAMIPELKLGVTVLTNQESSAAFNSIGFYVLDKFMRVEAHDWITAYENVLKRKADKTSKTLELARSLRNMSSKPSLPLVQYAGKYEDNWYGKIDIIYDDGKLIMKFGHTPELVGTLEHWQYDTFVVRWHDRSLRADAYVTFYLNEKGKVEQARMKPFSPEVDFSFNFQDLLLIPI
ncbi:serine hydrolase [Calditrichota bacterium]